MGKRKKPVQPIYREGQGYRWVCTYGDDTRRIVWAETEAEAKREATSRWGEAPDAIELSAGDWRTVPRVPQKRTRRLSIRVTDGQLTEMRRRADDAGTTVARYVLESALGKRLA